VATDKGKQEELSKGQKENQRDKGPHDLLTTKSPRAEAPGAFHYMVSTLAVLLVVVVVIVVAVALVTNF
jgi:hypothetical protein